jgi:hypothetical protein
MFQALLAHPQEVLQKRHLVYCMGVMSVGCTRVRVERSSTSTLVLRHGKVCTEIAINLHVPSCLIWVS